MAEKSNYILGHNISCNMDMIHEFSAGVNSLFMNAQDILNEGKGILNTISGIMGSIPGEALHGGLSDSIRDCLSRMEMCDMGMEGFVLVRKANGYVDNLYGIDSSHAEKVRGCAGYFQSLIRQNMQLYMSGENGKGVLSISQSIRNLNLKGSVDMQSVDNEEEELQRKLDQLNRYSNSYIHIPDPRGRDYYQKKMNEYFHAEIQLVLTKKIDVAAEKTNLFIADEMYGQQAQLAWDDVLKITKYCGSVTFYQKYYKYLESDINGLQSAIKEGDCNQTQSKMKSMHNIKPQLDAVSDEYVDWLWTAEGNKTMWPYIDDGDNPTAKAEGTVTLPLGITYKNDKEKHHWEEINRVLGWSYDKILEIRDKLCEGDEEWVKINHSITEDEAEKLFHEVEGEYIDQVNAAIGRYNDQNGSVTYYTQNQLEAMFDYAYNNGIDVDDINDPDTMLYYYLRKDQEGAIAATIEHDNEWSRRRLNQMNLFFCGDFNFVDSDEHNDLYPIKEKLGY